MSNISFISTLTSTSTSTAHAVVDTHCNGVPLSEPKPNPPGQLRKRFIEHLILQQKAQRTVQACTSWVRDFAAFHMRSPDQLGQPEIRAWILHLIIQRKLSASLAAP